MATKTVTTDSKGFFSAEIVVEGGPGIKDVKVTATPQGGPSISSGVSGDLVKSGYFSGVAKTKWGNSKLCIEINGNTATVYGFDPDFAGASGNKYITGTGSVSADSIHADINQFGEPEPDGTNFYIYGISRLTKNGGTVRMESEGESYNVLVTPQTSPCR